MPTKDIADIKQEPANYTKTQILASARYANRRDILGVLLKDDKKYTFDEVNKQLCEFMKGTVK